MENKKKKSKYVAAVLAFFLGGIGAHKFYLKQYIQGILYVLLLFTGISVLIGIIESIVFLCMDQEKFALKYANDIQNKNKNQEKHETYIYYSKSIFSLFSEKRRNNPKVYGQCVVNGKNFAIKGKKDDFVIKNKNHEFKIKNGEIVAYKNKNVKNKFLTYSEVPMI